MIFKSVNNKNEVSKIVKIFQAGLVILTTFVFLLAASLITSCSLRDNSEVAVIEEIKAEESEKDIETTESKPESTLEGTDEFVQSPKTQEIGTAAVEEVKENTDETQYSGEYALATEFDFTLKDLNGNYVTLSLFKGTVVVLNFWAIGCPPCRAEIPEFIEAYSEYKDKNVEFLGIVSDSFDEVESFVEKSGITYPILIDNKREVLRAYKINGIPATFIFDADGNLTYSQIGLMLKDQLISVIESALD